MKNSTSSNRLNRIHPIHLDLIVVLRMQLRATESPPEKNNIRLLLSFGPRSVILIMIQTIVYSPDRPETQLVAFLFLYPEKSPVNGLAIEQARSRWQPQQKRPIMQAPFYNLFLIPYDSMLLSPLFSFAQRFFIISDMRLLAAALSRRRPRGLCPADASPGFH